MSLSLESGGSTASLSQRDLSQEDELSSTTSGQSSVDLHPPDDSERLAMLTSAVSWIKGELAAMRDCDRGILQQLLVAHSTINDLRLGLNESQDITEPYLEDSSKDTLDDIKEDLESSENSTSFQKEATPDLDTPLNGIANSTPLHKHSTVKDEEDILRQFFGNNDIDRLGYLKSSNSVGINNKEEIDLGGSSLSSFHRGSKQDKMTPGTNNSDNKTMAQLKLEAKNEGRSSVAFEMQLFRQQLQEQAKSELAAFDKEFDKRSSDILLEPEARSYRHSILNRMDELLYPKEPEPRPHRSGSHIRQSSEPVVFHDIKTLEGSLAQRGSSARNKGGHFPSSQSTHFSSPNGRKTSEPAHHSFRMPSSQTSFELNRSGSGFLSGKNRSVESPHYDTSVIKRKSSSRNNTLEKSSSKQSLKYSVESLDGSQEASHYTNNDDYLAHDFQSPEHKSVLSEASSRQGQQKGGEGGHGKAMSFDVYPEAPKVKAVISPPYLQSSTNQKLQQHMYKLNNNSGRKKTGPRTFIRGNSENSWL